ncbi:hypothetical protein BDQ17DRAFT_1351670 [Cyathus striatus]|nr:hypothetical protein BDQ17DRAFT_1351670 [Cyathus striatus]
MRLGNSRKFQKKIDTIYNIHTISNPSHSKSHNTTYLSSILHRQTIISRRNLRRTLSTFLLPTRNTPTILMHNHTTLPPLRLRHTQKWPLRLSTTRPTGKIRLMRFLTHRSPHTTRTSRITSILLINNILPPKRLLLLRTPSTLQTLTLTLRLSGAAMCSE